MALVSLVGLSACALLPSEAALAGSCTDIRHSELCGAGTLEGGTAATEKSEGSEETEMIPTSENEYEAAADEVASPITLPAIFADGMVFQRGKTINVFGYCDVAGAQIKATVGDRTGTATAGEGGKWHIELDPINEPTWNLVLTVEQVGAAAEAKLEFFNVAVGEVWVMSGQSNAQLQVGYLEDVEELALLADSYGNIRAYRASAGYSLTPSKYGSATWDVKVTASDVRNTSNMGISAVGYAAVVRLAAELGPDTPIALIHVARGASKIKTWLDYESLAAISPSEAAKYNECLESGVLPESAHTKIGTILYNQQIAPLEGYEVAGVMWYQGCGDVSGEALGVEGKSYTEYFTALERVYRRTFGGDDELPFYVMELAPYTQSSEAGANQLADFKAEQFDFCKNLPNTYLVPNMTDGGLWGDSLFSQGYIHPGRKSTIGNRTADMILVREYGCDLGEVYTYPTPISAVKNSGGSVTVTFDTDLQLFFGDKPLGFELYTGSEWRTATGVISGNTITLSASGVSSPVAVRYGYSPTVAELADGTMVEFLSGNAAINKEAKTVTFTVGGKTYVTSDITEYVRTIDYGNVTNASGVPMPVFKLTLR